MRSDITSWHFFNQLGIELFDIKNLNLEILSRDGSIKNRKIISDYFSEDSLIRQLKEVYE